MERLARLLGFERLSQGLFGPRRYGAVVYFAAVAIVDVFLVSLTNTPGWPLVGLVMIDIRAKFSDRVGNLPDSAT